jgi:hypothetical protein
MAADDPAPSNYYRPGDRVEYMAAPVYDLLIETGEIGVVVKVEAGWVHALWPRSGQHSVPVRNVRRAGSGPPVD